MSLTLTQSAYALSPGLHAYFLASGGTEPYVYSILPGGAGGTINSSSGVYTAPTSMNANPALDTVTIRVTDSLAATADRNLLITNTLGLFCDIIQREMGLSSGRVYLWDQKLLQPTDAGLYVAVSLLNVKPFGNSSRYVSTSGLSNVQSVNVMASCQIDIISRDNSALLRKEEVLMALNSQYSQNQQTANSFYIASLSSSFVNLSLIDGAAIPYRYSITVNMQYFVKKITDAPYFDDLNDIEITTES